MPVSPSFLLLFLSFIAVLSSDSFTVNRDCGIDDTCVQCAPCFNASNHDGHDIVFSVSNSSGGCCDCGDEEAWKSRLCCKYHDTNEALQPSAKSVEAGPSRSEHPHAQQGSGEAMEEDQQASDEELSYSKGKAPQRTSPMLDGDDQLDNLINAVPLQVQASLSSYIQSMLNFVLDTLEHSQEQTGLPGGPDPIEAITRQPSLSPPASEVSKSPGSYFDTLVWPSSTRKYAVVLWNDEKHSFREVIDTVSEATSRSETMAKGVAERVDRHGREIIDISDDLRKLCMLASKLIQIDLAVTVRPAYDTFAEEVAGHVLSFLLDLVNASIFVPSASTSSTAHPLDGMTPNAAAMRALVARDLLKPWKHRKPVPQNRMSSYFFDVSDLRCIDGLLLMDSKMWKEARGTCKSLYMALIGPREVKRQVAIRFAKFYPRLIETFILRDREWEHSVYFLTVQLFSVPSIATELVEEMDFFEKLLRILHAIFTDGLTPASLVLQTAPLATDHAILASIVSRQSRCYNIFNDIRYLVAAEGVQTLIAHDCKRLDAFLDFLSLFQAIAPEKRAAEQHVEYEVETWMQVLQVATNVAKITKTFGEAYARASPNEYRQALSLVLKRTFWRCESLCQNDPKTYTPIEFHVEQFDNRQYRCLDFRVDEANVSFHHPMHWLLAELFKHVSKFSYDYLRQENAKTLLDLIPEDNNPDDLLVVFDSPLQVAVKVAQTRSGMWVRNGFGIRSHAHHYRDTMRDVMYDQDLCLLQCSLVYTDADQMLVTMLDRFIVIDWFLGERSVPISMDEEQYRFNVEEFLLLLITMLSETSMTIDWSMERQVRREIVHFLALSQGTYTEVSKPVLERLKDHSSFDRILAAVSTFRAPDGTTDLGIFELKDECYDEIQPYFFHYTRNQRELAEQTLRERYKRKHNGSDSGFVVVPERHLAAGQSPFVDELRSVFESNVLLRIVKSTISNALEDADGASDSYVDMALQLVMHGLVECGASYAALLTKTISHLTHPRVDLEGESYLDLLCKVLDNEKLEACRAKMQWIVDKACELDPEGARKVVDGHLGARQATVSYGSTAAPQKSTEDARRAAAKARQAAIMQQFSAQQKSLLESLEDEDDEDEDDKDSDNIDMPDRDSMAVDDDLKHQAEALGTCIFCQEELNHHSAFGSLVYVQPSRVLRNTPRHDAASLQQSLEAPLDMDRSAPDGRRRSDAFRENQSRSSQGAAFPADDHRFGFYASTCGHLMHTECFEVYCHSVEQRHAQQIARNHPEDLSRSEYVCPLCKSLGNVILPVPLPSGSASMMMGIETDRSSIGDWVRKINIDILKTSTSNVATEVQETEHGTGSFTIWYAEEAQYLLDSALQSGEVDTDHTLMIERLMRVLRPLSVKSRPQRMAYQNRTIMAPPSRKMYVPEEVVAYTISVLEVSQRGHSPGAGHSSPSKLSIDGATTLADAMSEQTIKLLQSLVIGLRDTAELTRPGSMSIMRQGLLKRLLPHWGGHDAVRSPLLLRSPLTILVEAAALAPESLQQITSLMFYVNLVQVVFGLSQPSIWPQSHNGTVNRGLSGLRHIDLDVQDMAMLKVVFPEVRAMVANICGFIGYSRGNITLGIDHLDDQSLAKMICTYTLPFLRRAAILYKAMGILPESVSSAATPVDSTTGEYVRLMHLLAIPLPEVAIPVQSQRQTAIAGLIEGWIKHSTLR